MPRCLCVQAAPCVCVQAQVTRSCMFTALRGHLISRARPSLRVQAPRVCKQVCPCVFAHVY